MYDMAKRSLAFTVATGGLLLTGTGYAPADAAVGFGTLPGPAQAQGSAAANQASPTSVSTPISVRGPESAAPLTAIAPKQAVRAVTPLDPRTAGSGAGAAATSTVKNSSGILTGNTVQIPIYLGLNLCTNQADAGALNNSVAGSTCGGSGAAGGSNSGASATSTVSHSRGILSGNTIQAPINIPVNACGNQAVVIGARNKVGGGTCGTGGPGSGGGATATAVTDHSGGILSGNIIQAPVNVPVNACGNQANVVALKDKTGGTTCSLGSGAPGSGGSTATAVTDHSGGIGSGLTVQTPINVPVNACGDQATVGGVRDSAGGATCSNSGGNSTAISAQMNSGGILSGWQGGVPINVPVTACGDEASVVGVHDTTDTPVCTMPSSTATETGIVENSGGILSGNQASVPINVPVTVCGDEVSSGVNNTGGSPECGMPPPTTPPPTTPPPTTPPPTTPPPTTPPPTTPPPTTAPPTTAPPTTTPPTGMPSTTPPHGPGTTPPGGGHGPGSLAHTGGEEGVALALGAGALLAGVGIRVASKRRSGGRRQV